MNSNVFQSSSTSISVKSSRRLSALVLKPIQDKTTTAERIKHSIRFNVKPVLDAYYPNVLNSVLSFRNELENLRLEAVKARNKISSKKRIYWWF